MRELAAEMRGLGRSAGAFALFLDLEYRVFDLGQRRDFRKSDPSGNQLGGAGVRQVVLLTGFMADAVETALGDSYAGMKLIYSPEPSPLGTAGGRASPTARRPSRRRHP